LSKRVLITGAAGGIGAAAAAALRAKGARVVGLDLSSDGEDIIACDVRDQESVDRGVAEAIERLGGLDVLINNAGIGNPQSAGVAPDEDALRVIEVNMIGPWRVTSAALPALRESGGRVVNVASGLAHVAFPFAPAYCMSKRGLTAYSDALRFEHGDALTVTTVYPGFIRTPIHETSNAVGLALEGAIPAERVEDAARTLVRAALGRPARDLATTRAGTIQYWLARRSPRRLVDRAIAGRLRRLVKGGHFDRSELAREFASRGRARRRLST
jgi:NAD(P)-dependent dehydrogenase (short-subunit alcohol dehydrogenase family)